MQPEPDVSKARELRPSVAAIIRNSDGRVLLQRPSDNGLWGLPGGSVEIGESVRTAIVREVKAPLASPRASSRCCAPAAG